MPKRKNSETAASSSRCTRRKTNRNTSVLPSQDWLCKSFENQSGEWEMVATDGTSFKFHQFVLGEQTEYFRALFSHPDTVEVKTKRLNVPPEVDFSGPALEAFLRYFYYKDTTGMTNSFSVTCALIRAGHYYNIPELVKASTETIEQLTKQPGPEMLKWFNVEDLWNLYQHVWLWEDINPFKLTLMEVIVDIIKVFCKRKDDWIKLLALTKGNVARRDLILACVKSKYKRPAPSNEEHLSLGVSREDALSKARAWLEKCKLVKLERVELEKKSKESFI